jgi:hypothetical protein
VLNLNQRHNAIVLDLKSGPPCGWLTLADWLFLMS